MLLQIPTEKRKRTFLEIINEDEQINDKRTHYHHSSASYSRALKRRRLNVDPSHSLSIPYQSLINPYKWLKTRHPSQQHQQRVSHSQRSTARIKPNRSKKSDHGELSNLLRFIANSNPLLDSDALIFKWHNILSGLSFELFRTHFRFEDYKANQAALATIPNLTALIETKNVYLARLKGQSNDDYFNLFGNGKLMKYAFNGINQLHLVSYLPAFAGEEEARESLIISEEVKYEYYRPKLFKDTQANHRLYLFADGFSYISMDNFYFYTSSESSIQFTKFLDQCLIPPSWSNHALRMKFNDKFAKETQAQRYKRQTTAKQKAYNNQLDDHEFASDFNPKRLSQQIGPGSGLPYINGNLFVEIIDMRYNEKHGKLHRLLLAGQSAYHFSQSLDDLALHYTNNYMSHQQTCSILKRFYEKCTMAKFRGLTDKYPFYRFYKTQCIRAYEEEYKQCVQHKNERDRSRHDRAQDDLRHCRCLQAMHEAYYPLHEVQKQRMQAQYTQLSTKYVSADHSKMKEVLRDDLYRLIKFASHRITKNQIEKQIYLRLYPCLCLKPSMEVLQVMSYAHYVTRSSLVRPEYGHGGIAHKMKSYYHHPRHLEECTQSHTEQQEGEQAQMQHSNVIVDGINQSQKFLHFIAKHGEQKLFKTLQSMRNDTHYLYDVGEKYEKPSEPRKNPGYAIPRYSKRHYKPKCCILKERNSGQGGHAFMPNKLIILRIDFLHESDVEIWMFSVIEIHIEDKDGINVDSVNYQYYLNNHKPGQIVYSQECLTLNCAAKLFHQHLRYQLYQHPDTKLVYSENTKFDGLHVPKDDPYDIFEIL